MAPQARDGVAAFEAWSSQPGLAASQHCMLPSLPMTTMPPCHACPPCPAPHSQEHDSSVFLGLDTNRLARWDMRDPHGIVSQVGAKAECGVHVCGGACGSVGGSTWDPSWTGECVAGHFDGTASRWGGASGAGCVAAHGPYAAAVHPATHQPCLLLILLPGRLPHRQLCWRQGLRPRHQVQVRFEAM